MKAFLKRVGKVVAFPVTATGRVIAEGAELAMVKTVFGVLRHVLTAAGGALVTSGYVSASDLETGVGAILTLAGIAWSVYEKRSDRSADGR